LITNHRTSRKNECRCLLKQLSPEEVQNRDISRVIRAIDHCRGLLRKKNRSGGNSTDTYIRDILRGFDFDNSLTVPGHSFVFRFGGT
jgi:hypothetical protein